MGRREEDAREARAIREDEIRERMARDADIMRGVGGVLSADDMLAYAEELAYAAVAPDRWEPTSRDEAEFNALLDQLLEDAEAEAAEIAAEERAEGLDYDDREHYDKEVGT